VLYEQLGVAAGPPGAGQAARGQPGRDALGWQVTHLTVCQCASHVRADTAQVVVDRWWWCLTPAEVVTWCQAGC
jgi:hypothetical protein